MVMHRGARPTVVARADGVDHLAVLGDGGGPARGVLEIIAQLHGQRIVALIEQFAHYAHQHGVVGHLGDAHVEQPVAANRHVAGKRLVFHGSDGLGQPVHQRGLVAQRGLRRQLAFDHLAGTDGFQRTLGREAGARGPSQALHIDARPHTDLDPALDFQRDQRLAHRGAGHAKLEREVAFGRQARAGRKLARLDQQPELVGDLAVQATRFDGLDRHGLRCRTEISGKKVKWPYQLTRILRRCRMGHN
ncbi:hypothetical protein FQZ97_670530 [compost metagenome]